MNTEFLNDKKEIKVQKPDGSFEKMTRKQAFESAVTDAYAYLRTERFVEIEKRLAANAIEQMGLQPGSDTGRTPLREPRSNQRLPLICSSTWSRWGSPVLQAK